MIFELDLFLTAKLGGPFYRVTLILLPILGLAIVSRGNKKALYWPLITFAVLHLGASVFAENAGLSRDAFKFMLYMLALFASSVSLLDSPSKAIVVLKLYLLSFVWYGLQGIPTGLVAWHPLLANEDSFGPLMVLSMGFSYFFGLATPSRRWRWFARGSFLLSILGVVVSFARGAALAAGAVMVYIVLRSPRRGRALAGLALAAILLLPVAGSIIPLDSYIEEIKSSAEGDQGRTAVWQLAWNVFRESPLYGVGAFNFGVVASRITGPDPTRPVGADPAQLWALWVHNSHLEILAEEGLIGIALWIAMMVGFFRRTTRLRKADARARWTAWGGGTMDLKMVSLGLEAAMVGYLACGIFYNQLYIHWFWSLLTISYVLTELSDPARRVTEEAAVRQ